MKAIWNNTVIAESDDAVWYCPDPKAEAGMVRGRMRWISPVACP